MPFVYVWSQLGSLVHRRFRTGLILRSKNDDKLITPALRAVGNVITGTDKHTEFCLQKGFLSCAANLLSHRKKTIVKETCWALSNVTAGTRDQVNSVITHGLVPVIIQQLKSSDFFVSKSSYTCLLM